ncbi:hypothetical protein [Treponema sp. R6D11]
MADTDMGKEVAQKTTPSAIFGKFMQFYWPYKMMISGPMKEKKAKREAAAKMPATKAEFLDVTAKTQAVLEKQTEIFQKEYDALQQVKGQRALTDNELALETTLKKSISRNINTSATLERNHDRIEAMSEKDYATFIQNPAQADPALWKEGVYTAQRGEETLHQISAKDIEIFSKEIERLEAAGKSVGIEDLSKEAQEIYARAERMAGARKGELGLDKKVEEALGAKVNGLEIGENPEFDFREGDLGELAIGENILEKEKTEAEKVERTEEKKAEEKPLDKEDPAKAEGKDVKPEEKAQEVKTEEKKAEEKKAEEKTTEQKIQEQADKGPEAGKEAIEQQQEVAKEMKAAQDLTGDKSGLGAQLKELETIANKHSKQPELCRSQTPAGELGTVVPTSAMAPGGSLDIQSSLENNFATKAQEIVAQPGGKEALNSLAEQNSAVKAIMSTPAVEKVLAESIAKSAATIVPGLN